jgi:hypothetical protein
MFLQGTSDCFATNDNIYKLHIIRDYILKKATDCFVPDEKSGLAVFPINDTFLYLFDYQ